MKNFKDLKERVVKKIKSNKLRIQGFSAASLSFMTAYGTCAYADINGGSIKGNPMNNILLPISSVVVGLLLIEELAKGALQVYQLF